MWTERLAHLQYILIWVLLIVGVLIFLGIVFLASFRAIAAVYVDHWRARMVLTGKYPRCTVSLRSNRCSLHSGHLDKWHRGAWAVNDARLTWRSSPTSQTIIEQVELRNQPVPATTE
jgi:hypothetical protein